MASIAGGPPVCLHLNCGAHLSTFPNPLCPIAVGKLRQNNHKNKSGLGRHVVRDVLTLATFVGLWNLGSALPGGLTKTFRTTGPSLMQNQFARPGMAKTQLTCQTQVRASGCLRDFWRRVEKACPGSVGRMPRSINDVCMCHDLTSRPGLFSYVGSRLTCGLSFLFFLFNNNLGMLRS